MNYSLWDKTSPINGVPASHFLSQNPSMNNGDVILFYEIEGAIQRVEEVNVIKSVFGIASTNWQEIAEEYLVKTKDTGGAPKDDAPLADHQAYTTEQIKLACQEAITAGFDSTVKGGVSRRYTLSGYDQDNIKDVVFAINGGATHVLWHYDGQTICDVWTAQEFMAFYNEKNIFVLQQRLYSDGLEDMVNRATTVEGVKVIVWGVPLDTTAQGEIDARLTAVGML